MSKFEQRQVNDVQRLLAEVIPALRYESEHHRAKRDSLIAECAAFVSETGDGEFALILSDALQLLPQVCAHQKNVFDTHHLFAEVSVDIEMAECRKRLFGLIHKKPHLAELVESVIAKGGAQ